MYPVDEKHPCPCAVKYPITGLYFFILAAAIPTDVESQEMFNEEEGIDRLGVIN